MVYRRSMMGVIRSFLAFYVLLIQSGSSESTPGPSSYVAFGDSISSGEATLFNFSINQDWKPHSSKISNESLYRSAHCGV